MDEEIKKCLDEIKAMISASKEVMNVEECAAFLGKSKKRIYNRMDAMPHYYGPIGIYFKRTKLIDWLCQVKHTPMPW